MQPYMPPPPEEQMLEQAPAAIPLVPHSREAEEAVCGAVLINPEAYYEIREAVKPGDFYIHRLRWVMEAFQSLHERRVPIDLLTVADALESDGKLAECGGPAYLTNLVNQVPSSLNAASYAQIVKGMSDRRKMIEAAGKIAKLAYDTSVESHSAFAEAEAAWQETRGNVDNGRSLLDMRTMMSQAYDRLSAISSLGRPPGIISNLLDLDRILHGFKKGRYYIVAGRPGDGKSAFLLTLARNMMKIEQKSILYFSIEMQESSDDGDMVSGGEISERMIGMQANIDTMAISDGRLTEAEMPLFTHAIEVMAEWRFTVDDDPGVTPDEMMARALKVKGEIGLDVIMVDYIQIQETPEGQRFGTRAEQVAYLSKRLKRMAKELNVAVIVAAQVNRSFASRGNKTLELSDLKDSGSLEQDAHVVIFLQPHEGTDELRKLEVAKHRGGQVGTCELYFDRLRTEFRNGSRRVEDVVYWWQKNGNGHNGNGGGNGHKR